MINNGLQDNNVNSSLGHTPSGSTKEYIITNLIMLASILLGNMFSPELGVISIMGCFIVLTARQRTFRVMLSGVLSALAQSTLIVVAWTMSAAAWGLLMLIVVAAAVAMGMMLRMRKKIVNILTVGVITYLIGIMLTILGMQIATDGVINFYSMTGYMFDFVNQYIAEMSTAGIMGTTDKNIIFTYFVSMMPSMIIYMFVSLSYFAFLLARAVLRRMDPQRYNYFQPFSKLRADKVSAVVFVVLLIGFFISTDSVIKTTLLNLLILIGGFMWLCGLSVAVFFVNRSKSVIVRILGYTILIFVLYFIMFLGVADAYMDLRRLNKTDKQE